MPDLFNQRRAKGAVEVGEDGEIRGHKQERHRVGRGYRSGEVYIKVRSVRAGAGIDVVAHAVGQVQGKARYR